MKVGVAQRDITPAGGYLSGFVARDEPATGAHDPITVRALVADDTAVVTVDVCGLDEHTCRAIREAAPLREDRILVHATHTHSGPASMPARLERRVDGTWLSQLVAAAADAITQAAATAVAAEMYHGVADDPGVAKNRRRPAGPVDPVVPVVAFEAGGRRVATVVSYACHPVVLGPDNRLFSADYTAVTRRLVEAAYPGSVCLCLTGCAGDVNTGHSAVASMQGVTSPNRTFAEAERVGARLADAVLAAALAPAPGAVGSACSAVTLRFDLPTPVELTTEMKQYDPATATSDAERLLFDCWHGWALEQQAHPGPDTWHGTVTRFTWGTTNLVGLPGEPFSAVAVAVRRAIGDPGAIIAGYCNGSPGYLPTRDEYPLGGYEVADAHRYYGMPGPFAPGSAEQLVAAVAALAP